MKGFIVGGYGGFGGPLTRLLLGDGAQVSVAGRDLRQARAFTCRYGGEALQLDVNGDLTPILRAAPDFVVDAVGPFHAYRADPYRLARFCIANNIHYLDLCEDAAFAAGISSLDTQAKAANCVILFGVSSVPAIASCAVAQLSKVLAAILLIETTILPDAGSPLEVSVAASALAQIGSPLRLWRRGVWRQCTGWSEPMRADLGPARSGVARLVNAPGVLLFPDVYGARSVICRVGLEGWMMNAGIAVLGYLRRKAGLGDLNGLVRLLMALSWLSSGGERPGARSHWPQGRAAPPTPLAADRQQWRRRVHTRACRKGGHSQPRLSRARCTTVPRRPHVVANQLGRGAQHHGQLFARACSDIVPGSP